MPERDITPGPGTWRAGNRWLGTPPPCGISHVDAYNPCLPEEDERGLWCVTCGLRQRLAVLPPRLAVAGYRTEVRELDDGQLYWHAWRGTERVNGGLSPTWDDACSAAQQAAIRDQFHRNTWWRDLNGAATG